MDLTIRRSKMASDDLMRTALKQPKQLAVPPKINLHMTKAGYFQVKKVKNVEMNVFGTKLARVHVGKQQLDKIQTRKMKGLKRLKRGPLERAGQPATPAENVEQPASPNVVV